MHYKIGKPNGLYHNIINTGYIRDGKNYTLKFSRSGYNSNSNRWDLMKKRSYTSGNATYVGNLMADVGNRVKMSYGANASGAYVRDHGINAFKAYGINSSGGDYNYSTVRSNLSRGIPVMAAAYANKESYRRWFLGKKRYRYTEGHAWVIDGYKVKTKKYTYTYEWELVKNGNYPLYNSNSPYYNNSLDRDEYSSNFEVIPNRREITTRVSTSTYLLMNWGWNGSYDSGEYSTSSSSVWKAAKYNFQYKKYMIYDFK